jgi:hypothetical protein
VGCPRAISLSKHLNLSYERAFGAYRFNKEIDVATQHNNCAANQDTAEHSITSVQPIRSEKINKWCRDRPRSDALVLRAASASIVECRLQNCLTLSASSMPLLGFKCLAHRTNVPYEQSNYMNFTLHNEQNRRRDNAHRPRTGNSALLMLMCSDGTYNHANRFRNGRGRSQSISWALQPVAPRRTGLRFSTRSRARTFRSMGVGRQDSCEATPFYRKTPLKRQVGRLKTPKTRQIEVGR